jgi:hypothetical protein
MSLMLYCVLAADRGARVGPPVIDDPAPWPVASAGLVAIVANADAVGNGPEGPDLSAALRFGRVVEHYHRRATVVPMRYGARLDDDAAVAAHLHEARARYLDLLVRLDDAVEMSLRLPLPATAAPVAAGSGRDYLRRRQQELEAAADSDERLERIDLRLQGLYRERRTETGPFAGHRMRTAHYLVPRAVLHDFQRAMQAAMQQERAFEPLISGPWPPYSFAADAAAGD